MNHFPISFQIQPRMDQDIKMIFVNDWNVKFAFDNNLQKKKCSITTKYYTS